MTELNLGRGLNGDQWKLGYEYGELNTDGTTVDPDGVDTVYFLFTGGNQNHLPFSPNPPQTTVRFGIPVTTFGHSGETFQIQVYGVDVLGNRGGTSTRQIHIR